LIALAALGRLVSRRRRHWRGLLAGRACWLRDAGQDRDLLLRITDIVYQQASPDSVKAKHSVAPGKASGSKNGKQASVSAIAPHPKSDHTGAEFRRIDCGIIG